MSSFATCRCDIFCTVIDNFGDIGVCWRMARQLAAEHGMRVRLWIDNLQAFARICPAFDDRHDAQSIDGVDICHWRDDFGGADFAGVTPGNIVIEAFGCRLPDNYVEKMATLDSPPAWINLEYLSAEPWVSGCHALPSPHPRLALTKYFFFPGFDETTGGLLRERLLAEQRRQFLRSEPLQASLWHRIGVSPPAVDALKVSLFAYENSALPSLLTALADGPAPGCCFVPLSRTQAGIESFLGQPITVGDTIRRGSLEIHVLPFVAQQDYDRLLWACDLNFVRGEDSFVRAQWAARPMIWHIYPQSEGVHRVKLDAFLDRYLSGMPDKAAEAVRNLTFAWNDFSECTPAQVTAVLEHLPDFRELAGNWEKNLSKQEDLCASLVRFCKSKL
ncbi:elongation factor P maturation arginine rhamnosyltransferase EarP [uncultured Propionivibrio sp.]|uniref:elongation factor P maturation arginine rhamnosyltransferase EarP n=1 Tax=uncultured Propionivibrio sp. TaxID=426737 RepID=UPI0029BFD1D3|nr:elongation factor P maturation arginine rhamnosyltransferase EarP [uncultured Propionivibrio sp.]